MGGGKEQGPFSEAKYQAARWRGPAETLQKYHHLRWVGEGQVPLTAPTSSLFLLQARTWVLSALFKIEHQVIGTPQKPLFWCILWLEYCCVPGEAAAVLLTLQTGIPPFPFHFVHFLQSQPCWDLLFIGLAPLLPKLIMISPTYVSC